MRAAAPFEVYAGSFAARTVPIAAEATVTVGIALVPAAATRRNRR